MHMKIQKHMPLIRNSKRISTLYCYMLLHMSSKDCNISIWRKKFKNRRGRLNCVDGIKKMCDENRRKCGDNSIKGKVKGTY